MRPALLLLMMVLLPGIARAQTPAPPAEAEATPDAECRVLKATGDRFCKEGNRWVLANARPPAYPVGADFPVYEHSMLMDLTRYGLPPVDGPWRYYVVDRVIYKVSATTAKVIEVVGPTSR